MPEAVSDTVRDRWPPQGQPLPGEDESDRLLLHVGRTIWENVPVLLCGSVLLLVAAAPGLFLATGASWVIAWPVLVLWTGPVWAGIVAASGRLLDGDAVTLPALLAAVRRHAPAGVRIAVVPAVVGTVLFGSLRLLDRNPDAGWIAIPLLIDTGVAIVACACLVSIFTIATERGIGGVDLWLASAGVAMAGPVPVLGTLTLFGLVLGAAAMLGPVAGLALAPLAVLCAAVTREALPDAAD